MKQLYVMVLLLLSLTLSASERCNGQNGGIRINATKNEDGGFVSATATVEGSAYLGTGVSVCDNATIGRNVEVRGNNVVIKGDAVLEGNVVINGDNIVISGVVKDQSQIGSNTVIKGTVLGTSKILNSTIESGIIIENQNIKDLIVNKKGTDLKISTSDLLQKATDAADYLNNADNLNYFGNYIMYSDNGTNTVFYQKVNVTIDETNPCNLTIKLSWKEHDGASKEITELVSFGTNATILQRNEGTVYFGKGSVFESPLKVNFSDNEKASDAMTLITNLKNGCELQSILTTQNL